MPAATPLPCIDCGVNTSHRHRSDGIGEYYHVEETVWFEAFGATYTDDMPWWVKELIILAGFLCIGCLEERLGRRLTPDDFSDAPVNQPTMIRAAGDRPHSARLLNRMGY